MDFAKLRIVAEAAPSLTGVRVELDGHDVTAGLRELTLTMTQDNVNAVALLIGVDDIDISAETLAAIEANVRARPESDPWPG